MKHGLAGIAVPIALLSGAANVYAQGALPPAWWTDPGTAIVDVTVPEDNYAPVNLGQLKHVAQMARIHLDQELSNIGGAWREDLINLIDSFVVNPTTDFAPANLGQLKAVAKPFYDQLGDVGYDTWQNLRERGYPEEWPSDNPYPWDPATPVEENYAPANIGQLKLVFSFDLAGFNADAIDTVGNGIADWWERKYFGEVGVDPEDDPDGDGFTNLEEYQNGTDPLDFYNGQPPIIELIAGDGQMIPPGGHTFEAFQVRIRHGTTGEPLENAPVRFEEITQHPGLVFAPVLDSEGFSALTLRTASIGMISAPFAAVFFRGSEIPGTLHSVQVAAGSSEAVYGVQVSNEPVPAVEAPRQLQHRDNGDGTVTFFWTGSPSGADRFVVEEKNALNEWIIVVDLDIAQLSYDSDNDTYHVTVSGGGQVADVRVAYISGENFSYSAFQEVPRFIIVDLGPGPAPLSVTDQGWVLRGSQRWRDGQLETLQELADVYSARMNENGYVFGPRLNDDGLRRAAVWPPGSTGPIPTPAPDTFSSTGHEMVAAYDDSTPPQMMVYRSDRRWATTERPWYDYRETFFYSSESWNVLRSYRRVVNHGDFTIGTIFHPRAMNNYGDFVGEVLDEGWQSAFNLRYPLGFSAREINDHRTVVGSRATSDGNQSNIVVWDRFGLSFLEPAFGVSNPDVRMSNPTDGFEEIISPYRPHYWRRLARRDQQGNPTDRPARDFIHAYLDDLIAPGSAWSNLLATAISANGVIVGTGSYTDPATQQTTQRAFMLVKLPPFGIFADTDRNGVVDPVADAIDKSEWTNQRGAIYNVNFDRDGQNFSAAGIPMPDAINFGDDGLANFEHYQILDNDDALDITPFKIQAIDSLPQDYKVFLRVDHEESMRAVHIFKKIAAQEDAIWGAYMNPATAHPQPAPWAAHVTALRYFVWVDLDRILDAVSVGGWIKTSFLEQPWAFSGLGKWLRVN